MKSMLEINKKIDSIVRKFNKWEEKPGTIELFINGKMTKIPIIRRYMKRYIKLCLPTFCDAGDNCCHYFERKEKGFKIGLCQYADSYYDILYEKSVVLDNLQWEDEKNLFDKINKVLERIAISPQIIN
jgi:hypothetical protein